MYQVNKKTLDSHQHTNIESLYLWLSTVCGTIILVCCLPICCCSNVKKERFARACCVEGLAVMLTFIHDLPLLGASLYIMHFTNLTPVCQDKSRDRRKFPMQLYLLVHFYSVVLFLLLPWFFGPSNHAYGAGICVKAVVRKLHVFTDVAFT